MSPLPPESRRPLYCYLILVPLFNVRNTLCGPLHLLGLACVLLLWIHFERNDSAESLSTTVPQSLLSTNHDHYGRSHFKVTASDFPGGPVTKTPHSQCKGPRLDPWSRSWIPRATTKCLHAAGEPPPAASPPLLSLQFPHQCSWSRGLGTSI